MKIKSFLYKTNHFGRKSEPLQAKVPTWNAQMCHVHHSTRKSEKPRKCQQNIHENLATNPSRRSFWPSTSLDWVSISDKSFSKQSHTPPLSQEQKIFVTHRRFHILFTRSSTQRKSRHQHKLGEHKFVEKITKIFAICIKIGERKVAKTLQEWICISVV